MKVLRLNGLDGIFEMYMYICYRNGNGIDTFEVPVS